MIIRRASAIAAAILLATGAVGARGAAEPAPAPGVTVTVMVFSGLPDPTFTLTDDVELARCATLLGEAPHQGSGGKGTILPSKLGYHGIAVDNPRHLAGLPVRFAVYGGTVEVGTDDKELFGDPANRLASYLLDLAVAKGAVDRALAQKLTAQGLR